MIDRRRFLAFVSAFGASSAWLGAQEEKTPSALATALAEAEKLSGLELTPAEREMMVQGLEDLRAGYQRIREVAIPNSVPPALSFAVEPGAPSQPAAASPVRLSSPPAVAMGLPANLEDLAFAPLAQLSRLLRARQLRSLDLTKMYLARLKKLDPALHCVVHFTEERALAAALRADQEIAAGTYRGPLHGIPWGAKDLLAAKGTPTTWGSVPYKEQEIGEDSTAVDRMEKAGAVLVAKLSLGELAMGDVWFGGMTRNPWNLEQGSSGSSAGSAAASVAGLVGFALGTETLGSIVSPCTRTGATGLRPTFGRVSRHGAMALSWSMDKIGPIGRNVEDCALVFHALHGADGLDPTAVDRPFAWDPDRDPRTLRVGYCKSIFEAKPAEGREEWHAFDLAVLDVLRAQGIRLVPIELPQLPVQPLRVILSAEASAAFDELTRSAKDDTLVRQTPDAWPNRFRLGQTIPAVAYIQANRIRTLLMREMAKLTADLDAYVCPSYGGDNLLLTNLTGHPAVVVPNGFRKDGTPTSITFTGKLFGEAEALTLAKAYQGATDFHLRRPQVKVAAS
jgi:Asp-tRNA(Asn)/Glu-tRNA(Gln) amidotransferase A subunit family amidase